MTYWWVKFFRNESPASVFVSQAQDMDRHSHSNDKQEDVDEGIVDRVNDRRQDSRPQHHEDHDFRLERNGPVLLVILDIVSKASVGKQEMVKPFRTPAEAESGKEQKGRGR